MWPQATELSISVLWLLVIKKGDSSASLEHSEKCVHVISLSKGSVVWTIWEPSINFFHSFSHSCIKTALFFPINLHLFHYHLQYPDSSDIFSLPNPYQVHIQQLQNSSSLSQSMFLPAFLSLTFSASLFLAFLNRLLPCFPSVKMPNLPLSPDTKPQLSP